MSMSKEEWKDVVGFEGFYQVSSKGRVRSMSRTVIRSNGTKQTFKSKIYAIHKSSTTFYPMVTISKNGKSFRRTVHSMECEAFIPNPKNKKYVNHKDGIRWNNELDNLEWSTPSENNFHAYRELNKQAATKGKIPFNAVKVFCTLTGKIYETCEAASFNTKYSKSRFSAMIAGTVPNKTTFMKYTEQLYNLYKLNNQQL